MKASSVSFMESKLQEWKEFWQWYDGKFGESTGFAFPPKEARALFERRAVEVARA